MWDAFFIILNSSSRDEGIGGALLRWLMQLIFNFTIGLFGALVHFMWTLWGLITSYGKRRRKEKEREREMRRQDLYCSLCVKVCVL